jgi:hypothetical protein
MTKNVAQYNVGTPILVHGEAGRTFVMQPGNVDRVVEFLDVAGITPTAHTVLTYNLHAIDGDGLTYAIRKGTDLAPLDHRFQRAADRDGGLQPGCDPVGKESIHFVLESGDGRIEISGAVLWYTRPE